MFYYICLFGIATENSRAMNWGSRFVPIAFVFVNSRTTLSLMREWISMQSLNVAVQQGWITNTDLHLKMFISCCINLVACFAQLYLSLKMRQFSRLKHGKAFDEEKVSLI